MLFGAQTRRIASIVLGDDMNWSGLQGVTGVEPELPITTCATSHDPRVLGAPKASHCKASRLQNPLSTIKL
eukprot:1905478-Amphidinium_carterae.1